VDHPGLAAAEIFAAAPKFYRRFYFRPSYRGWAALVMLRDSGERRRLLKEGRQFLSFKGSGAASARSRGGGRG
jgi:hypothetical protein